MIPEKVSAAFTTWQRRMVKSGEPEEESAAQAELAQIVNSGAGQLSEYLFENLMMDRSQKYGVQVLHRKLSAGEASDPPKELEEEIAVAFSNLRPSQAIRPVYWTVAHAQWMMSNLLGDDWVRSLKGKDDDGTTRNVCRRLGGLHHIRGRISVFRDCPVSRAWWRVRISRQAAKASKGRLTDEHAYALFRRNTSWEALVGGCVRNVAVINDPRAIAAICVHIHSRFGFDGTPGSKYVTQLTRALARHSIHLSFAVTPFEEMLEICDKAAEESAAEDKAAEESAVEDKAVEESAAEANPAVRGKTKSQVEDKVVEESAAEESLEDS